MNDLKPRLFACPDLSRADAPPKPVIATPLGGVKVNAIVDGVSIWNKPVSAGFVLQSGASVICWQTDRVQVELLVCRPILTRYGKENCDDCVAALWRIAAHGDGVSLEFAGTWLPGHQWHDAGADTGQGVFSWLWHGDKADGAIGTEDDEWLERRAANGDWLPKRWQNRLHASGLTAGEPRNPDILTCIPRVDESCEGLGIVLLPELNTGEVCQSQWVVAWAQSHTKRNPAMAVDVAYQQILAGAGLIEPAPRFPDMQPRE